MTLLILGSNWIHVGFPLLGSWDPNDMNDGIPVGMPAAGGIRGVGGILDLLVARDDKKLVGAKKTVRVLGQEIPVQTDKIPYQGGIPPTQGSEQGAPQGKPTRLFFCSRPGRYGLN